jgi:hypothetical protein
MKPRRNRRETYLCALRLYGTAKTEGTGIVRKTTETVDAGESHGEKLGRRPKETLKRRPGTSRS